MPLRATRLFLPVVLSTTLIGLGLSVPAPTFATSLRVAPGPDCSVIGTPAADVLRGTAGPDVICGLGGGDVLLGLGGDDVLRGGPGADRLRGGAGDDRLIGALGADILTGGAGADVAVYRSSAGGVRVTIGDGRPDGTAAQELVTKRDGDRFRTVRRLDWGDRT